MHHATTERVETMTNKNGRHKTTTCSSQNNKGCVLQQPWSLLKEPAGPILSTWRRGSHLIEPVGPMSTRALYSGTVPRPGGSPRQRRPLRSLWAFAYLLGRLSSDLRQSSFFPSQPSNNGGPWNGPRFNRQKTCTCVSQDSNRIPDGSQEKALPLRH